MAIVRPRKVPTLAPSTPRRDDSGGHRAECSRGAVEIRRDGALLASGSDGRLLPAVVQRVAPPWDEAVRDGVATNRALFGDRVHSVYVRGSVARGTAVVGRADLDLHALVRGAPELGRPARRDVARRLEAAHPWCPRFELRASAIERLRLDRATPLGTMLALLSLCVAGADVRPMLPRPRAGREAWMQLPTLERALDRARADVDRDPALVEKRCGWLARRIVRAGLELASVRVPVFSRDLYPCYRVFAHVFPEHGRAMWRAVELGVAPTPSRADLLALVALGESVAAAAARA